MNRTIVLPDKSLTIRVQSIQDAEDIHKYVGSDPEMSRYTGWNPYQTIQSTIEKIEQDDAADNDYSWVVRKDEEFVGIIGGYDYKQEDSSIEIGYSIARKDWGKGYAGAVAKAIVEFLLSEPQIQTIRAWSHKDNIASKKVLLGAGFRETGMDGEHITFEINS